MKPVYLWTVRDCRLLIWRDGDLVAEFGPEAFLHIIADLVAALRW